MGNVTEEGSDDQEPLQFGDVMPLCGTEHVDRLFERRWAWDAMEFRFPMSLCPRSDDNFDYVSTIELDVTRWERWGAQVHFDGVDDAGEKVFCLNMNIVPRKRVVV